MPEKEWQGMAARPAFPFQASWLGNACLLLLGVPARQRESFSPTEAWLVANEQERSLALTGMIANTTEAEAVEMLLVGLGPLAVAAEGGMLRLSKGPAEGVVIDAYALDATTVSTGELVRSVLAPLDARGRTAVCGFLATALELAPPEARSSVSEDVHQMREALRERLPAVALAPSATLGAHVDRLLRVDDYSFFVDGWIHSDARALSRVTAVSPEGARAELSTRLMRSHRPDVSEFFADEGTTARDDHGMLCFFELETPSVRTEGWIVEIEDSTGHAFEVAVPKVIDDPMTVRGAILAAPPLERPPDFELMERHVLPAITRIQRCIGADPIVAETVQFGEPPADPEVSVIVPLYRRIDHLEAQLAEFADDSDLHAADLVYVLDSPEMSQALRLRAADLYPIYRVPLRIAVLKETVGFAGACNAGAGMSRGRLLLLLNSDVLPDRSGWLEMMREFYDATPAIGALGPKLMYEDDSIQHAGMYYEPLLGTSLWVDGHFFKGMHRSLPAANIPRSVPLLSGACLMIDRGLYHRIGGLPTIYVQGDYEDADLCLRLLSEGLNNWYIPHAELYHLEGQSYPTHLRQAANRFNMWLHNRLHREHIEAQAAPTAVGKRLAQKPYEAVPSLDSSQ